MTVLRSEEKLRIWRYTVMQSYTAIPVEERAIDPREADHVVHACPKRNGPHVHHVRPAFGTG